MIDLVITTFDRVECLKRTVESFFEMVPYNKDRPYRTMIIDDCSSDETQDYLRFLAHPSIVAIIHSCRRSGVVHGFNLLWSTVEYIDSFYEQYPYMCYLQDDLISTKKNWPFELISLAEDVEAEGVPVGFLSGWNALEHPIKSHGQNKGRDYLIKASTSAANLLARKDFWRSIGYIPRENPDGSVRGFPGNGRGSHIDLYLTGCQSQSRFVKGSAAVNSSFSQEKVVLVMPGSLEHIAKSNESSTWRNRNYR